MVAKVSEYDSAGYEYCEGDKVFLDVFLVDTKEDKKSDAGACEEACQHFAERYHAACVEFGKRYRGRAVGDKSD